MMKVLQNMNNVNQQPKKDGDVNQQHNEEESLYHEPNEDEMLHQAKEEDFYEQTGVPPRTQPS